MSTQLQNSKCLLAITGAFDLDGGIAAANRLAIHALHEAGYRLHVLSLVEKSTSLQKYAQFPNLTFQAFESNKARFALTVLQSILTQKYRRIFCDHVNLAWIMTPFATLRLARYAVRLNGIEVFPPKPDREGKLGLYGARYRLAISEYTHQRTLEQFPDLKITTCDLSLGPDQALPDLPHSMAAPLSFTAVDGIQRSLGSQVILLVGRMSAAEQYKGQDTLIQAMPLILDVHPNTQLVLVGRGDDAPRLQALAQAQPPNTQAAIFMPGYVSDETLDSLYAQCFVFAMPSRGEGFGFVYIEAMRWGKPCIGSKVDAAQCIIVDGVTGALVDDPGSPAEVAEKVIAMLSHPEQAAQMGSAGRQRVQDHFTFDRFKSRFLKALSL